MKPKPGWVKRRLELDDNCRPEWVDDRGPMCDEGCPAFDGKRCELLGHRPGYHCEPAVVALVELTRKRKRAA